MFRSNLARKNSFLTRNLLGGALIALATAVGAQAATFNAPAPASIDFDDNNCPSAGSLTGVVTNGGAGLSLSGSATVQGYTVSATCYMSMTWSGTGSGSFTGTTTVTPNFTLVIPADVEITCTLTIFINGIQEAQYNCYEDVPGGTYSLSPQTIPVPATLSTYSVQLVIQPHWTDTGTTTFSVTVAPDTSIDIMTTTSAPTTPAPSSLILTLTGILLVGLVGFGYLRRQSAGAGFPGSRT